MLDTLGGLQKAFEQRYEIQREVGSGGTATVYLARDLKHDRLVALKILKPELAAGLGPERFVREIMLTARLDHPLIVPLLDSGEAAGFLYYVMPYVEGESLRSRLSREKQLSVEVAVKVVREVADALSYAHGLGIVHRDIKPENILLAAGHARVADFGIARAIAEAGGTHLTETGVAVGTPAYMSPEQASGVRDVDARSDVYSLACVTYELLAGQPPFTGATAEAILARKSIEDVPRLRTVRPVVSQTAESAIARALERVPADRFETADQFAHALEVGSDGSHAGRSGVSSANWATRTVAGILAIAAFFGIGWWGTQQLSRSASPIRSIVVLPLRNLTGDPGQEYFVDGMHEAVIASLSKVSALTVISRTSAMAYRGTDKKVGEIARELGVEGVIEGSVTREADQVRVTVQLIDAGTDQRVWGATYQRELRGVLALHSEVAEAIANEVDVTVSPVEHGQLARARPVDPEAYTLYLMGGFQLGKLTETGFRTAIDNFQAAIRKDSTFAPAWAGMSIAWSLLGFWHGTMSPAGVHARALDAALGAVQRDSSLAESHVALALVRSSEWNWGATEDAFRRAIQLNPSVSMVRVLYANFLTSMGRFEESAAITRQALRLDPLQPIVYNELAFALEFQGRDAEALEQYQQSLRLVPDFSQTLELLATHYALRNQLDEAVQYADRTIAGLRGERAQPAKLGYLGYAYARAKQVEKARGILDELTVRSQSEYVPASALANVHLGLGQGEEAIQFLLRAEEQRDINLVWLSVQRELLYAPIKDDPRFQALVRRMGFPAPDSR